LLTGDLMTQSRVAAAAERCGASLQMASDAASLVAKCTDSAVPIVLIDLTFKPLDIAALVAQLKSFAEVKRVIIAFGPHVHESLLATAEEAGCDEVLSRGQFFGQLDAMLERLIAASQ
jgi:DNA-binding response OmpR family regulator